MKSFAASDLKTQIGSMFMAAAKEPVQITKRGKEAFVLMAEEQFRRFEGLEDALWAFRAQEALKSGFVGTENAESILQNLIAEKAA